MRNAKNRLKENKK